LNWIQLSTVNGKHYRLGENAVLEWFDFESMSMKECDPMMAGKKYIVAVRDVDSDETVTSVNGMLMDFDMGYALGLVISRSYRFEDVPGGFVAAFREVDTLFPFLDYIKRFRGDHEPIRHAIGISIKDEEYVKVKVECPEFVNIMKHFGWGERKPVDARFLKHVPMGFKRGLFVGLFDARASIHYHTREKHRMSPYYIIKMDISNSAIYRMAMQVVRASEFNYSEYFHHCKGQNRNIISFKMATIQDNMPLLDNINYWKLRENLDYIAKDPGSRGKSFSKFPINLSIRKKLRKKLGKRVDLRCARRYTPVITRSEAKEIIEGCMLKKSRDKELRRWAELLQPNIHFDMIKKVSTTLNGRSCKLPRLCSVLPEDHILLS